MIILSNGSVVKLANGSWLNVQETQNSPEPTPSETPVEEEYCPNCGEVWDGEYCANCGYPDNMGGDDPDDPGLDDPGSGDDPWAGGLG